MFSLATNSSCDNGSNQMGDDGADISCHQNVASHHAVEENKYQGGWAENKKKPFIFNM